MATTRGFLYGDETWKSKMKAMITTLALGLLAAGPVFAQSYIPPQRGYFGFNANSPAITGSGSLGYNRLQQTF
jgi:hypothetical protein